MHIAALSAPEQRVLGCLIEKHWTTPDQYPLSVNALRLACNQSTNRDPVTDYDEQTVRDAAQRLSRYGLTRLASYHGSRAIKYRHLADEVLGLDRPQLAVLAVLLLRGPQTPGELKGRTERMHRFASLEEVEAVLVELGGERDYVQRLDRRPGQKEDRFAQLLGGDEAPASPTPASSAPAPAAPAPAAPAPAAPAAPAPAAAPAAPAPAAPASAPAPAAPATGPTAASPATPPPLVAPQPDVRALAARVTSLEDEVALLRAELGALQDRLP